MLASSEERLERLEGPESNPALSSQSSLFYYHFLDADEAEVAAQQFEIPPLPPVPPRKGESWKTKIRFNGSFKAPDLKALPWKTVKSRSLPRTAKYPPADPRLPWHYSLEAETEAATRPNLKLRHRAGFPQFVASLLAQGFEKSSVGTYKKLYGKELTVVRTLNHTMDPESFWVETSVYPQP